LKITKVAQAVALTGDFDDCARREPVLDHDYHPPRDRFKPIKLNIWRWFRLRRARFDFR
jgi:hypothetical protein